MFFCKVEKRKLSGGPYWYYSSWDDKRKNRKVKFIIEVSFRLRFVAFSSFSVDLITVLHDLSNCLFSLLSTFLSFLSVGAAFLVQYLSVSLPAFFLSHRVHH